MSYRYACDRSRHVWTCDYCGVTHEDRGNWRRCLDSLKALGWRVVEDGRFHLCTRCVNSAAADPHETSQKFTGTEVAA